MMFVISVPVPSSLFEFQKIITTFAPDLAMLPNSLFKFMNPFIELGIRHDIVNAISELGFENPTPIQEQSIPVLLTGSNDFVGLAQ
ncbi:MAG: box helicase, partial [Mucilaginibacter sp.]|nr:box helicase [Mucilaginibacter sp.]